MNYLESFGPRADPATALTWGLGAISVAVVLIITVLVLAGVVIRKAHSADPLNPPPVKKAQGGQRWIVIGLVPTLLALIASTVWTVAVLASVDSPPTKPAATLEVTGHQWWWEIRYDGAPQQTFTTANEIHVPVGAPVLIKLRGADVIHSFWIPALTGKTDTIPGRTNIAWLQADRPGVYRGQCTEYCGEQHAHMAIAVVAEAPAAFQIWREAQLKDAAAAAPSSLLGQRIFVQRCGSCHTVRGTEAGGVSGPDLTHLMSRRTIAAGLLPNTTGALAGWISDPQSLKPGALMPPTRLSASELDAVRAYLETLR